MTVTADDVKTVLEILQAIVIIAVTVFTARWTYKTFAHKEKISELKELKGTIELFHFKLVQFCIEVRETKEPDQRELSESAELARIHNKLVSLASLNLYTKVEVRQRVLGIVGRWLARTTIMQRRPGYEETEAARVETWRQFTSEYEEVRKLIDKEAGRVL